MKTLAMAMVLVLAVVMMVACSSEDSEETPGLVEESIPSAQSMESAPTPSAVLPTPQERQEDFESVCVGISITVISGLERGQPEQEIYQRVYQKSGSGVNRGTHQNREEGKMLVDKCDDAGLLSSVMPTPAPTPTPSTMERMRKEVTTPTPIPTVTPTPTPVVFDTRPLWMRSSYRSLPNSTAREDVLADRLRVEAAVGTARFEEWREEVLFKNACYITSAEMRDGFKRSYSDKQIEEGIYTVIYVPLFRLAITLGKEPEEDVWRGDVQELIQACEDAGLLDLSEDAQQAPIAPPPTATQQQVLTLACQKYQEILGDHTLEEITADHTLEEINTGSGLYKKKKALAQLQLDMRIPTPTPEPLTDTEKKKRQQEWTKAIYGPRDPNAPPIVFVVPTPEAPVQERCEEAGLFSSDESP